MKKIEQLNPDDTIILSCAFRYALGRRTYVVSTVVERLKRVWPQLREGDRKRFKEEIREHERQFDLGHDCDKRDWYSILELED